MADPAPFRVHQDPALFREAVMFTAAETRFAPRLIEKDYFCTVILQRLEAATADLVFRGGTCLAKVHVGFYRLSEDLDFLIPTPATASRAERSRRVARLKAEVAALARELPGLRVTAPLTGANDSTQYAATLGYHSMLGSGDESVKIEVGLREPLLAPSVREGAQTRLAALRRQIDSQLKPVLRDRDFAEFDLDRAFATVAELAATLAESP